MKIKKYLEDLGIVFKVFAHPPVYTCEEAEKYNKDIRGIHSKNLFVKDRKSRRFFLVILPADEKLDLEMLGKKLGEKIKFANDDDLKEKLGLERGAVSPFGLVNDSEKKVEVVISEKVWNADFVSFHPNVNTETLELRGEDFHKFVESVGNRLDILK